MRRTRIGLSIVAVVLLSLILPGALRTSAQEATPSTTPAEAISVVELAPSVTAEIFAAAPSARAEGQTIYVACFVFQPGAEIFPHSHPGTAVLAVESGVWGWSLLDGTAHVVRGAATGGTTVEDVTELGTEILLNPGDAIYYEDDVVHTGRGASDEPTVLHATAMLTAGEPLLMPVDMPMGTPTA